ncbi:BZ3500_MvSof-1268-A1-R1_Chr12-3g04037 [Microbotryum saponariae]|uniref:BZ3500_MvSof-1268-A1-R1_Chr12-3g04037 protein n=1 Tax=Microbotryum saponariae TaxID=289078 RepID=A0A2X0MQF7_9BASI|nr:BZ3500_MvSof-1268-A1-R1_Chr12-3g04037 [Microbotryum saponariae]SDA02582.1 BZ3501_MvSof-1269-A2-R1_Chr12-3g03692 [Microbotryum saponariae]
MKLLFVVLLLTAIGFVAALPFDNRQQPDPSTSYPSVYPKECKTSKADHKACLDDKGSTCPKLNVENHAAQGCAEARPGLLGEAEARLKRTLKIRSITGTPAAGTPGNAGLDDSVHASKYRLKDKPRQFRKPGGAFSTMSHSKDHVSLEGPCLTRRLR